MALGNFAPRWGLVSLQLSLACFVLLTVGCSGNATDCRDPANVCPAQAPFCDQASGICRSAGSEGGCALTGCQNGKVCCESAGCAGQCVEDCRVPGRTCPAQAPLCDQASGVCRPAGAADAGEPQPPPVDAGPAGECATTGCPTGKVCCPAPAPCSGQCVPDCRVPGSSCPPQKPTCDQTSGLCG